MSKAPATTATGRHAPSAPRTGLFGRGPTLSRSLGAHGHGVGPTWPLRIELSAGADRWEWRLTGDGVEPLASGVETTADEAFHAAREALYRALDDGLEQKLRSAAGRRSSIWRDPADRGAARPKAPR